MHAAGEHSISCLGNSLSLVSKCINTVGKCEIWFYSAGSWCLWILQALRNPEPVSQLATGQGWKLSHVESSSLLLKPDHPYMWDLVLQHGRILVIRPLVRKLCLCGAFPPVQRPITACFILGVLQTVCISWCTANCGGVWKLWGIHASSLGDGISAERWKMGAMCISSLCKIWQVCSWNHSPLVSVAKVLFTSSRLRIDSVFQVHVQVIWVCPGAETCW